LTKLRINELVENNSWRPGVAKFTLPSDNVTKWRTSGGKITSEIVQNKASNMLQKLLGKK